MTNEAVRPTIHEVSRVAGVSISSVSRALNGQTRNSEIIRRVEEAAASIGYVPSAIAQSLRRQKVGQIALAVEDIGNPAYLAMVRGSQPVFRDAGFRLVLHSTEGDVDEELEVVRGLNNGYVDGLVICPIRPTEEMLRAMEHAARPVVVIGRMPREAAIDNVRGDSYQGTSLAVRHLVEKGARRIAIINGPHDTMPAQTRLHGFRDELERQGLFDPELVEQADGFLFDDGRKAATRLLARGRPDAILGITDRLALGALHAVRDAGLTTPDDIRIVGIDDSEVAATSTPGITSVDLGAFERGRIAAELMISRLEDSELRPREVVVPPFVAARESTR